ncbi:MAG: alpha/beta hydrolase [Lautropia sp.]|nr:alpha/beta hydrolase [Lautropia sp.]
MSSPGSVQPQLLRIDVRSAGSMESQSGLQMLRPRIFGALLEAPGVDRAGSIAAIVIHPTSNFHGHYLLEPLAARGVSCMGLNTRYVNNDSTLLMERVIQDLGAGIQQLRAIGYRKVMLIGNSGGAALVSFYQAQAEQLTLTHLAHGAPFSLSGSDLPPVEGIALAAAHAGRARLMREWIDPAVIDENDPMLSDPELDLYAPARPLPLDRAFLARFRAAQRARYERLEAWVTDRLGLLKRTGGPQVDQPFVLHRTHAEPRCVDIRLDANERKPGSVWGDPRTVNLAANSMGRFNTLTSFMSQWSSRSQADGPDNLARTSVPVLHLTYRADQSVFPSTVRLWLDAAAGRIRNVDIQGGDHYLIGRPDLVDRVADEVAAFAGTL